MMPNELCHYTKRETALEKILLNKTIRLGKLGLTNDPKETKTKSIQVLSDVSDRGHIDYRKIAKYAEMVTKNEWKVFCLTKSLPPVPERTRQDIYLNYFSNGYNRPRMWAQYGENHSGVCLVFDGNRLSEKFESLKDKKHTVFHGSVSYDSHDITPSKRFDFSEQKVRIH
jgi:hypothetical protein